MEPDETAYEAFNIVSVTAAGYGFYGLRRASVIDGILTVDCGYLTPGMPPDGEVVIVQPSKDVIGQNGKLITTLAAARWDLSLDSGEYRSGTIFRYTATVDYGQPFTVEFENEDTPGELVKVVSL
jgi:hypothetical protein